MGCSIILNDNSNHQKEIAELFENSTSFDCLVAFANYAGFKTIQPHLITRLEDENFMARFLVGLDFFHTDPNLLDMLLIIARKCPARFQFYISSQKSNITYHPKVYAFYNDENNTIIVGSANLTKGGLEDNYEASARLDGQMANCKKKINQFIVDLIEGKEMVPATKELIEDYRTKHAIYVANRKLGERKAQRLLLAFQNEAALNEDTLETLKSILEEMIHDKSEEGFAHQTELRRNNRRMAAKQLEKIRISQNIVGEFLSFYEPLCQSPNYWHSGGLSRGKSAINREAAVFQNALIAFDQFYRNGNRANTASAYQFLLEKFSQIPRAGTNVITEILHTYNNEHFAIMNQNSVHGMKLAGVQDYPSKPDKTNLKKEDYALFCGKAKEISKILRLKNLSELDAVLNYAYW